MLYRAGLPTWFRVNQEAANQDGAHAAGAADTSVAGPGAPAAGSCSTFTYGGGGAAVLVQPLDWSDDASVEAMLEAVLPAGLAGPPQVHPPTWTVLQQDGPNHLRLWCNALPEHQMAPVTSGCALFSWSSGPI